jgi:2-methylcitrate dehydratase PrpD
LAGLALAAQVAASTRTVLGAPLQIPAQARSVEGGLAAFAAKWGAAGPVIVLTRFGRFLSNKIFNCRVGGTTRSYILNLGAAGATVAPGLDPYAHGDVVMEEQDWLGVLYGDYTGLAPALAGRFYADRDDANRAILLGIIMYVFAHIPAGANPDPDLLLRILAGAAFAGGLPTCAGQPAELQVLDDFLRDPRGQIGATLTPPTRSVDVTHRLAEWVAGLRYEQIPPGAIANAKIQLTSILGALYAGSVMKPGERLAGAVRDWNEGNSASVFGRTRFCTTARNAAMVNSYLSQILEWEDWTFLAHSGASVIPVVLAAGEHAGASGKQALTAIVAANEILARAGEVLTDAINTGNALTIHQLETTLAAAKMLGLSAPQMEDALGIACTQPQMTSIIAWTADAKGMLTAWPAATAVTAALLAGRGLSGSRTIVENPLGYAYRVSDIGSPQQLNIMVEGLGQHWRFDIDQHQLFTKRYPTDGFQMTTVEAILQLRRGPLAGIARKDLASRISKVEGRIPLVMAASASMFSQGSGGQQALFDRVADPNQPDWTYIALLFDGVWPVAAGLADGELTYRQYRDDKLRDPVIRALAGKVIEIPDVTQGVYGATARITLTTGEVFERSVPCIDAFPVREKLDIGAAEVESRARIETILRAINNLESYGNLRDFAAVLNPGGCPASSGLPGTNAGIGGAGPLLVAGGVALGEVHARRKRSRGQSGGGS